MFFRVGDETTQGGWRVPGLGCISAKPSPWRARARATSSPPARARASRSASSSRSSTRSSREKRASASARTRAIIIYPMNALANSQLEELDKFVANVAGRAARHVRALHGPGRRRGAAPHRRQPARHPAHQLHDARAPDDAAGRARSQGHRQLRRACASSCSTSCTPTAAARAPTSRCSCAACASAWLGPRAPVHRHLGHDGERRVRCEDKSRVVARWRRSSSRPTSRRATSSSRRSSGYRPRETRRDRSHAARGARSTRTLRRRYPMTRACVSTRWPSGSRRARRHGQDVEQRWVRARAAAR